MRKIILKNWLLHALSVDKLSLRSKYLQLHQPEKDCPHLRKHIWLLRAAMLQNCWHTQPHRNNIDDESPQPPSLSTPTSLNENFITSSTRQPCCIFNHFQILNFENTLTNSLFELSTLVCCPLSVTSTLYRWPIDSDIRWKSSQFARASSLSHNTTHRAVSLSFVALAKIH